MQHEEITYKWRGLGAQSETPSLLTPSQPDSPASDSQRVTCVIFEIIRDGRKPPNGYSKKCLTFFIGSFGIFLCLAIQLLLISLHGYGNCIRLNFCNEIYLAQTLNFIFFVFCETFGYIYLVQDILKHDYVLSS